MIELTYMKNSQQKASGQKGSVNSTLLVIIIVLLVIIGGVYLYNLGKQSATSVPGVAVNPEASVLPLPSSSPAGSSQPVPTSSMSPIQTSAPSSGASASPAMLQYTDPEFGFSFWYPSGWQVTQAFVANAAKYPGGTVLKQLNVTNGLDTITVEEYVSPGDTITDSTGVGACPVCVTTRYYYNFNIHEWMAQYPNDTPSATYSGQPYVAGSSVPANVSLNTMGGLHMLAGSMRFGANTIIPLSAQDFLVIAVDGAIATGSSDPQALAKTVVALDPDVATPVSAAEQAATVQDEASVFAQFDQPSATTQSYNDLTFPFTLSYPSDFALASSLNAQQQRAAGSYMGACPVNGGMNLSGQAAFCYVGSLTSDGFEAAALDITASSTLGSLICAQPEPNESDSSIHPQQVALNGTNFYESHLNDAGLGHYQSTDSYRTYHEGVCYTTDLKIDSDRGNSTGLSPDFSAMMSAKLQAILSTFRFTR